MEHSTAKHEERTPDQCGPLRSRRRIRLVLIPDTDGEVVECLSCLEELLLALTCRDEHGSEGMDGMTCPLPVALCDGRATDAVAAIYIAVADAERNSHVKLIAPNGRYELVPLIQLEIAQGHLDLLGTVAHRIADALGPRGSADRAAEITVWGRAFRRPPERFAVEAARLHAALTMPIDDDARTLIGTLRRGAVRVTLSTQELASYLRLVERFLATWSVTPDGHVDPLTRFLYRGFLS